MGTLMTVGRIKVLQAWRESDVYTWPRNIHLYIEIKPVYRKIIQRYKRKWNMYIGREFAIYRHK